MTIKYIKAIKAMPFNQLKSILAQKNSRILSFVLIFALVGGIILLISKAATPNVAIEAESGTVAAPTTKVSDTAASGGSAIQFKPVTTRSYYVIGSGDIGKTNTAAKPTGDQIRNLSPAADAVFTLGDNAYESGTLAQYQTNYEPFWGSFKSKTYPSPGNHDYNTAGATEYYQYYNATPTSISSHSVAGRPDRGYYAWDIGTQWRFYSLNSEANIAEANAWLDADMKANRRLCQVGYWHKPPWTTSAHPPDATILSTYVTTMYNNGGDIIMTGHNHVYERFYPQNPASARDDARGITSFVVGTGGASFYQFPANKPNLATRNNDTFGNLLLTIKDDGNFSWNFLRAAGGSFTDSGSGKCHL